MELFPLKWRMVYSGEGARGDHAMDAPTIPLTTITRIPRACFHSSSRFGGLAFNLSWATSNLPTGLLGRKRVYLMPPPFVHKDCARLGTLRSWPKPAIGKRLGVQLLAIGIPVQPLGRHACWESPPTKPSFCPQTKKPPRGAVVMLTSAMPIITCACWRIPAKGRAMWERRCRG